jgi:drug/metabolite transporter superfamily protein YnfA
MVSLALFGWLLALSPAEQAGRAYAVYGGIYIAASLGWLWAIEGFRPDHVRQGGGNSGVIEVTMGHAARGVASSR